MAERQSIKQHPRVVLLVGVGRSGSTLFERVLGGVPGVTPLGETVHLWERGLRDDEMCGCGELFSGCVFWQAVGRRAFGGWDQVDADEAVALRHEVVRTRYVPELLWSTFRKAWRLRRDRFARLCSALYEAVSAQAASGVLVDSSKMAAYAALLTKSDLDLRCVEMVRDPRGVAYSWTKTVVRPEVTDGSAEMPRYETAYTAIRWSLLVGLLRLIRSKGVPTMTIRYEDFITDPRGCIESVLNFAGHSLVPGDLDHIQRDHVALRHGHLVAGNPMRFQDGEIALEHDVEWRTKLSTRDRRVVSTLTAGLRHRYGYH